MFVMRQLTFFIVLVLSCFVLFFVVSYPEEIFCREKARAVVKGIDATLLLPETRPHTSSK